MLRHDRTRPGMGLQATVEGEVRFYNGSRGLYATDASNYRQAPIGVVIRRTVDDVVATVAACRQFDAPVLSRGGGTSLADQRCNVAVVMNFTSTWTRCSTSTLTNGWPVCSRGSSWTICRRRPSRMGYCSDPSTHNRCTPWSWSTTRRAAASPCSASPTSRRPPTRPRSCADVRAWPDRGAAERRIRQPPGHRRGRTAIVVAGP